MSRPAILFFAAAALGLVGCKTEQQQVTGMQPEALKAAQERGRFELGCPAATGQVLSNEMVQTGTTGPLARNVPPQRAEYTVGVEGCGKRATYYVVCAEGGTGCVAAGTQNTIRSGEQPSPNAR